MKYFIFRVDKVTGEKTYRKNKTIEGWSKINTSADRGGLNSKNFLHAIFKKCSIF